MLKLKAYFDTRNDLDKTIILKNSKHHILHKGPITQIPDKYLPYYILEMRRCPLHRRKTFIIIEDADNGTCKEN